MWGFPKLHGDIVIVAMILFFWSPFFTSMSNDSTVSAPIDSSLTGVTSRDHAKKCMHA
jgi:hypothetical protein